MNSRALGFLVVAGAIAALVWMKEQRPEVAPARIETPVVVEPTVVSTETRTEMQVERFTMHVTLARPGNLAVSIELLDHQGQEIERLAGVPPTIDVPRRPGVTHYRVRVIGHESQTRPWPEGDSDEVALAPAGSDVALFAEAPTLPQGSDEINCFLRFCDADTGRPLAGVAIELDGQEVARASADGEVSLPFARLRDAKLFGVQLAGYAPQEIPLTPGRIDEIQVAPLRLHQQ